MPHTMPSIVSKLRVTLRFNATQASRMISTSIRSRFQCLKECRDDGSELRLASAFIAWIAKPRSVPNVAPWSLATLKPHPFLPSGLISQRLNRIDRCRPPRGIQCSPHSNGAKQTSRGQSRAPARNQASKEIRHWQHIHEGAKSKRNTQPDSAAQERDDQRLDEKLPQNGARGGTDCLSDSNLAGPLPHRDQHHVHYANAPEQQSDN